MTGPMQPFLYIHDAILREVAHLEEAAKELDRDDEGQVGALAERLSFFERVLKAHEDAEEESGFDLIKDNPVPGTAGLPSLQKLSAEGYTVLIF